MFKKILLATVLLVAGGLLSGCEQEQNRAIEQLQAGQIDSAVGSERVMGRGNGQGRRFVQSDYVVDKSDKVTPDTLLGSIEKSTLSTEEKAGLIKMREEEKLAHDVYVTMYEKWGQNIFKNISGSEQTHTDTIKYLLQKYNIKDPVKSTAIGVFTNPEMTKLYNSLVEQGSRSLLDALKVGATVEDLDIKDLEELLPKTDNEDIRIAYQNLNKGSRNHIRAFVRNLERNGGEYSAQFISQSRYEDILAGEQERGAVDADGKPTTGINGGHGNGRGNGQGNGRGRGNGNGSGMGNGSMKTGQRGGWR